MKITNRLDYKSLFEKEKGNALNYFEFLKVNINFDKFIF